VVVSAASLSRRRHAVEVVLIVAVRIPRQRELVSLLSSPMVAGVVVQSVPVRKKNNVAK
jgi:hypothetical protein